MSAGRPNAVTMQIKNVPEEIHAVFRRRAAAAHMSLQEYMLTRLIQEAGIPTMGEWLDEASSDTGGAFSFDDAVTYLRHDRAGH